MFLCGFEQGINITITTFKSHCMRVIYTNFLAITMNSHELKKMSLIGVEIPINQHVTKQYILNKGSNEIKLDRFSKPIKSIIISNGFDINNAKVNGMSFYRPNDNSYSELLRKTTTHNFPINSKSDDYLYYNAYGFDKSVTEFDVITKLIPMNKLITIDSIRDHVVEIMFVFCNYLHCVPSHSQISWNYESFKQNENYYPLSKLADKVYVEGYWQRKGEICQYPFPKKTNEKVDEVFLANLEHIMKTLNGTDNAKQYFGASNCRICDKYNGSNEYKINYLDNEYRFPDGLIHYYKDHNVQPSMEFKEIVMKYPIL